MTLFGPNAKTGQACFECYGRGWVSLIETVGSVQVRLGIVDCPRCGGSGKEA